MARRLVAGVLAGVMVLAGLQAPSAHAAGLTVGLSSNGSTTGLTEWAIGVGQSTSTFYALVSGGTASSFRWWTEDTAVATVSPNGDTATVRGVGDGATKLWVEAKGGGETVTDWAWMSVGANVVDTPGPVVKSGAALYRSRTTASASRGVLSSAVTAMLVTHTSGSWVRVTFPATFVFSADDSYAARAAWVAKSSVDIPPSSVSMSPATLIVEKGRTGSLSATTLQSYANDVTVSWSSGATGTATVSSAGVVSGVNEGVTSVTVAASSSHGVRLTDAATVSVYTPMAAVAATARVAVGARSVADGTSAVLVSLATGGAVSVVGVCGSYFLVESGGKRGFVPITAIRMPPPEVTLDKSAADLEIGKTLSLTVSAGASYRWWSDDTTVATVTTSGRTITVTGKAQGVAQVWVELTDRWGSVGTASAWVTVFADVPDTAGSIAHRDAETWLSATTDGTSRGALAAEVSGTVTAVAGSWVRLSFPSGFSFSDGRSGSTAWLRKADVDIPPVSVAVDVPTRVVEKAGMTQATAIVGHDYANDVALSWTSGATGVATITDAGVIRGVSEGVSVLRVAAASSHGVRFTDTTTVSVYTPDPGVGKLIGAASLRPVADDRSSPVGAAAAGDQVIALGPCGEYLYIDRDGVRGFVPKSAVAVSAALVSLGASAVSVGIGAKTVLLATPAEDAAELSYAWSSTDPELADVSGTARQGTVIGRSEGVAQARVEATDAADESWPAAAWVSVYTPVTLKGKAVTDAGVRMSALPDAPLVAVVDTGAKVSILGVLGGYYYVQAGDERGYVDQPAIALAAGKLSITPAAIAVSTEGVLASVRGTVASGVVDTWEWKSADPRVATAESTRPAVTATGVIQGVTKLQVTATDATGEAQKAAAWVTTYEPFPVTMKGKAISDTPAREAATTDAATWGTVKTGAQVTILGQSGSWWYTDIAGTKGFVPKATVIVQVTKVTAPIAVDVPVDGEITAHASPEPTLAEVSWDWTVGAPDTVETADAAAAVSVYGVEEGASPLTVKARDRSGGIAQKTVWATAYTPSPQPATGFTAVATAVRYWAAADATPLRQLGKGNVLAVLGSAGQFLYVRVGNTTGYIARTALTVPATAVAVDPTTMTVGLGESEPVDLTLTPAFSTAKARWVTANSRVATVASDGTVTGRQIGSTIVTAMIDGGLTTSLTITVIHEPVADLPATVYSPAGEGVPASRALALVSTGAAKDQFRGYAWGSSKTKAKYQLQRRLKGGTWKNVAKTAFTGTGGQMKSLSASFSKSWKGKTVQYRLVRLKSTGKVSAASNTVSVVAGKPALVAVPAADTRARLIWRAMSGIKGYRIEAKNSKGKWVRLVDVGGASTTSRIVYAIDGKWLKTRKAYSFRLAACTKLSGGKCTKLTTSAGKVLWSNTSTTQVLDWKAEATAHSLIKAMLTKNGRSALYEKRADLNHTGVKTSRGDVHPFLKFLWADGVLEMHTYLQFRVSGSAPAGSRTAVVMKLLITEGIKTAWGENEIVGTNADFGSGSFFRTKVVIHEPTEKHNAAQRYLQVQIGGPGLIAEGLEVSRLQFCYPYWYSKCGGPPFNLPSSAPVFIYFPWDTQVDKSRGGPLSTSAELALTGAHEFGHAIGLGDAYDSDAYGSFYAKDRMFENSETAGRLGDKYTNLMAYDYDFATGTKSITEILKPVIRSNDMEMVIYSYGRAMTGIVDPVSNQGEVGFCPITWREHNTKNGKYVECSMLGVSMGAILPAACVIVDRTDHRFVTPAPVDYVHGSVTKSYCQGRTR